jgi:hypothetical protein
MRVLITGSPSWPDPSAVYDALTLLYRDHGPFTLVHGASATGADAHARHWFQVTGQTLGCAEDAWPADFEKFEARARGVRDVHMFEAGADQVLAYPTRDDMDTQRAITLAEKAGIPVRKWKWNG